MSNSKDEAVKRSTTDPVKKAARGEKQGFFARLGQWFRDLRAELKRVIWPTRKQTTKNTTIALGVIAVFSVVLWGFDWVAASLIELLLKMV